MVDSGSMDSLVKLQGRVQVSASDQHGGGECACAWGKGAGGAEPPCMTDTSIHCPLHMHQTGKIRHPRWGQWIEREHAQLELLDHADQEFERRLRLGLEVVLLVLRQLLQHLAQPRLQDRNSKQCLPTYRTP